MLPLGITCVTVGKLELQSTHTILRRSVINYYLSVMAVCKDVFRLWRSGDIRDKAKILLFWVQFFRRGTFKFLAGF